MSSPKLEVVSYRIQRANEAIDDAQADLDQGRFNSASNRVYYAMFYAALALLATRDLSSSRHSGVIALFHENFVKVGAFPRELAHYLGRALEMRSNTDYRIMPPPEPAQLREMLDNARSFVKKVAEMVQSV